MKININMSACIAKIAAKGNFNNEQAAELLQEVANRGEKLRNNGDPEGFTTAAKAYAEKLVRQAERQTARAIVNAGKREQLITRIIADPEQMGKNTRAILQNENGADQQNVANMSGGLWQQWTSVLHNDLRKAGLFKYAQSEAALSDISTEMFNIRKGAPTRPSSPAYETARIMIKTMEAVVTRLNGEGADIQRALDYVFHTSHDPDLMRQGGRGNPYKGDAEGAFQQWWKTIRPLLEEEKTFEDVIPRENETEEQAYERFGRDAFNAMYTGTRKSFMTPGGVSSAFEGTNNLARKISEGRVFFFKDGASWAQYMKSYGRQLNALEMAQDAIKNGSRWAGILHFLGDNPEGNMDKVIQQVKERLRNTHQDQVVKYDKDLQGNFLKLQPSLDDLMYQVGAKPGSPVDDFSHSLFSNALKLSNMAYLGFVGITHLTSLPSTFSSAGFGTGMNSFQIISNLAHSMLPHAADRTAALSEMGALYDNMVSHNPYDNGVTTPGVISSMHDAFMTATGIRYVMRHAKSGFVGMFANHLANQSLKDFSTIPADLQRTMSAFGIDQSKWELIRSAAKIEAGGRQYVTPKSVLDLSDNQVRSIFGPESSPDFIRRETADQLMMMYSRMGDLSTVTPGPRERALLHGSKPAGTDLSSLFTQFAAWPLAATHQIIAKTFYESQSTGKALWTLGTIAGISMLSGYGRTTIRNLIAGRPPETPKNAYDTAFLGLRSMAAGGAAGILGDYLFGSLGQAVKNGEPVGGPVIGTLASIAGIAGKAAHALATDQKYDPWPEAVHLVSQNIPFANLFYLKGAIDYLALYHIFEAAQPGWWANTNRARIRRGDGAYAGYMPGAPIPWNPLEPEMGLIRHLMPQEQSPQPGAWPSVIGTRG